MPLVPPRPCSMSPCRRIKINEPSVSGLDTRHNSTTERSGAAGTASKNQIRSSVQASGTARTGFRPVGQTPARPHVSYRPTPGGKFSFPRFPPLVTTTARIHCPPNRVSTVRERVRKARTENNNRTTTGGRQNLSYTMDRHGPQTNEMGNRKTSPHTASVSYIAGQPVTMPSPGQRKSK